MKKITTPEFDQSLFEELNQEHSTLQLIIQQAKNGSSQSTIRQYLATKQAQEQQRIAIEKERSRNIYRCSPKTKQKTENALRSGQPVPDKNIWKQELIEERASYLFYLDRVNPIEHPRQLDWK